MLYNEAKINTRFQKLHFAQTQRAAPKYWKNGKRKGQLRVPGIDSLPYTWVQLKKHIVEIIGVGATRCHYCVQIGRPAEVIDIVNCVLDHIEPLARGGQWNLENLYPCCADCNLIKGSMSQDTFLAVGFAIFKMTDMQDQAYILKCLRTRPTWVGARDAEGKKAPTEIPVPPRLPRQRTIAEAF